MISIVNTNVVEFMLLIGYIVLLKTGDIFDKRTEKLLQTSVVVISALILTDIGDSYFSTLESLNELRYLTTALGYTLRPVALSIFIMILLKENESILHIWIPVIIIAIVSLTSYWTHIMFYFTDNNVFQRGPLGYFPHIMAFGYMGILAYYSVSRYKITDTSEIIAMVYSISACLIAFILEAVFSLKFILTGAILSSCMVYYSFLSAQVYKIDSLTRAYNRISFDKDSEKKVNKCLDIINVDLDNLKTLNDTKGHSEGDKALVTLSNILINGAGKHYRVYRVGGDEFYVVGYSKETISSETYIRNATKALNKTSYTASFGHSKYKPGQDFAKCCIEADRNMYENKKNKP